jgi:hypothetical protein
LKQGRGRVVSTICAKDRRLEASNRRLEASNRQFEATYWQGETTLVACKYLFVNHLHDAAAHQRPNYEDGGSMKIGAQIGHQMKTRIEAAMR